MDTDLIGAQLAALWGRENLRPVPARVLDTLALSDAEWRLLADFGLPTFWGGPLGTEAEAVLLGGQTFLAGFAVSRLQCGAVIVGEYPEIRVNTDLARFAACLVLHRTLLAGGAALSRRSDSADAPLSEPMQAEYRAAMTALMDDAEREMRRADPLAWEGVTGMRADYFGEQQVGYWPATPGEYDWYAMWDAGAVYARWAGVGEDQRWQT